MNTDIEQLRDELDALKLQLLAEQVRRRSTIVEGHKQSFEKLRIAILNTRELQSDYEGLIRELDLADFFALVGQVNSPVANKMGFTLMDVVYDAVDNVLLPLDKGPNNEDHKRRFSEVLKKVFDNPIASALINSNPVTGVIGKVVDFASGFVDSVIDRTVGRTVKKIGVSTQEVIGADRINAFAKQMEKYEKLYGDLAQALTDFRETLSHVKSGMRNNLDEYGNAYDQFLTLLALNESSPFVDLDKIFHLKDTGWDGLSEELLGLIAADDRINVAVHFASNMERAETRLNTLRSQFSSALVVFQDRFVEVLQRPIEEDWQDIAVDRSILEQTIKEIQTLTKRSDQIVALTNLK